MKGRPARGRRRLQMLHMLAKDGYVVMKREAEDKRQDKDKHLLQYTVGDVGQVEMESKKVMSKTCCIAEY